MFNKVLISIQQAIDLLPDGVLIVNDRQQIEMANAQAGKLFGYNPDELTGQDLSLLIPARYRQAHKSHITAYNQHPAIRTMGEGMALFGLRHDGTEFDVDIALSPVEIRGQKLVIATVRDITEKKDLARALQWKNEQLEAINTELERFGYTISHDLKSPLANLQAIVHMITRELPQEKQEELRNHIYQLNQTLYAMGDLISGVVAYSKATLTDAADVEVDLNLLIKEVRYLILLPSHIRLEVVEPLPVVRGNKTKLLQVLLNLLSNALKYNDKPAGHVRVSGKHLGNQVLLTVEDNGPGIEHGLREKVFGLFEKGANMHSDSHGIGLAIVSKVVQGLGGSISIEDSELGGVRFEIMLPGQRNKAVADESSSAG